VELDETRRDEASKKQARKKSKKQDATMADDGAAAEVELWGSREVANNTDVPWLPPIFPSQPEILHQQSQIQEICRRLRANELEELEVTDELMMLPWLDAESFPVWYEFDWYIGQIFDIEEDIRPIREALEANASDFGINSVLRSVRVLSRRPFALAHSLFIRTPFPSIRSFLLKGNTNAVQFFRGGDHLFHETSRIYRFFTEFDMFAPNITEFCLINMQFGYAAAFAYALRRFLNDHPRLEKTTVDRVRICIYWRYFIGESMKWQTRRVRSLVNNSIGDDWMKWHPTLRELYLANNSIGDDWCKYMAANFNPRLTRIDLSGNRSITDIGAAALKSAIENPLSNRVEAINLSDTTVPRQMQSEIELILLQNRHLRAVLPTLIEATKEPTTPRKQPRGGSNSDRDDITEEANGPPTMTEKLWIGRAIDLLPVDSSFMYLALRSTPHRWVLQPKFEAEYLKPRAPRRQPIELIAGPVSPRRTRSKGQSEARRPVRTTSTASGHRELDAKKQE